MYPTKQHLIDLGARPSLAELYSEPLAEAAIHYKITTPERVSAFLAQIFHETLRLRYAREIWGPTAAQKRYEGRRDLGNTVKGDGKRYMGRGLIQVTGRNNYGQMRDYLRKTVPNVPDFVLIPEAMELPKWAAFSAGAYWSSHNLNALADKGEFDRITKTINGGYNGKADRDALYAKAKRVLA